MNLAVATAAGRFIARYSDAGLVELKFPTSAEGGVRSAELKGDCSHRLLQEKIRGWHRLTAAALKKVLAGRPAGKLPPLDWADKTEFQKSVWRALLKTSPGHTKSYGEIAQAIGKPRAVRAVGGACGANPVPVLVPCHRVLAANQKLGGFSGGLDWKRKLLAGEGVNLADSPARKQT